MRLAQLIIEIFEDYLEEKGVEINNPEREDDDFAAQIYGTEYGDMENKINETIFGTECVIDTNMGTTKGIIEIDDNGITIISKELNEYMEKYSME